MRFSQLETVGKSGVRLDIKVDSSDTDHLNYRERLSNPSGYTKGRSMRAVAEIPFDTLQALALSGDKDGVILFDTHSGPLDKRVALRRLLARHPEFRISEGNI